MSRRSPTFKSCVEEGVTTENKEEEPGRRGKKPRGGTIMKEKSVTLRRKWWDLLSWVVIWRELQSIHWLWQFRGDWWQQANDEAYEHIHLSIFSFEIIPFLNKCGNVSIHLVAQVRNLGVTCDAVSFLFSRLWSVTKSCWFSFQIMSQIHPTKRVK